jgi:hypothetical protein
MFLGFIVSRIVCEVVTVAAARKLWVLVSGECCVCLCAREDEINGRKIMEIGFIRGIRTGGKLTV